MNMIHSSSTFNVQRSTIACHGEAWRAKTGLPRRSSKSEDGSFRKSREAQRDYLESIFTFVIALVTPYLYAKAEGWSRAVPISDFSATKLLKAISRKDAKTAKKSKIYRDEGDKGDGR